MSDRAGISGPHLAPIRDYWGGVTFWLSAQTLVGTSSYPLFPGGAPFAVKVIRVRGIMTGAGGAGDTVQVKDGSSVAISNAINVAALSAKDTFEETTIDTATYAIQKGQNLTLVTASDALALVFVECVRYEP